MLSWCSVFAFSGYVAAIECSRVQVERPSCSTSGGHSGGIVPGEVVVGVGFVLDGELSDLACLVRLRQAATEVQVRQLERFVSFRFCRCNAVVMLRTACRLCRGRRPWVTGPWSHCLTLCASLRGFGWTSLVDLYWRSCALVGPRPFCNVELGVARGGNEVVQRKKFFKMISNTRRRGDPEIAGR